MENTSTDQGRLTAQRNLIEAFSRVLAEDRRVQIFETHISLVLVTKDFAYKFKKAVRFDFLDFSTLDARHFYCHEELRLNRRLAPAIYLDVVAITGSVERPAIDGPGVPLEYAVKMYTFPQEALWTRRIENKSISAREIDVLAKRLSQFHQNADVMPTDSGWNATASFQKNANETLATIAALVKNSKEKSDIKALQSWHIAQRQKLAGLFSERETEGAIRECHGDLHGGNILTLNDQVEVFDCIEFNESLRWIDVVNDIAFICMDLKFHGRHDLAARLLNQYLQLTGDYQGVAVLRYYEIHRALIRCKIALLDARQSPGDSERAVSCEKKAREYLAYSIEGIKPARSTIMITHGYSGSGKSTFSRHVVELFGAVQIRSDIERKRMHGLAATASANALPGSGLYDSNATDLAYRRLLILARRVAESGMPVIIDAAFLEKEKRQLFSSLAREIGVPFFIFDVRATEATMKARIASRAQLNNDPSDADLAVLAYQMARQDPLNEDEMKYVLGVDNEVDMDLAMVRQICAPVVNALGNNVVMNF